MGSQEYEREDKLKGVDYNHIGFPMSGFWHEQTRYDPRIEDRNWKRSRLLAYTVGEVL